MHIELTRTFSANVITNVGHYMALIEAYRGLDRVKQKLTGDRFQVLAGGGWSIPFFLFIN